MVRIFVDCLSALRNDAQLPGFPSQLKKSMLFGPQLHWSRCGLAASACRGQVEINCQLHAK